ncbi:MAG: PQQ-binding-like beta-propeller repeat protein [Alphaproteobacteria bacterium]
MLKLPKNILLLMISASLVSCANDGRVLPGERQSVLPAFSDVSVDEEASNEDVFSDTQPINTNATHAGGNERHSGGNLSLVFPLSLSWSARTKGIKDNAIDLPQPIIASGRVFSIDGDSKLHAFALATGTLLWSFSLDPQADDPIPGIKGGIAYRNGVIVAHSGRQNLYALDVNTGSVIWQKTLDESLRGGPTLSELNSVIVTDLDGQVYVFTLSDGTLIWQRSGFPAETVVYGTSSPAILDQNLIVSGQAGEMAIYNLLSGALLWADSLASFNPRTPLERLGDIRAFAATDQRYAYFISQSGRMSAFEVNSGFEVWAKPLSGIEMPWIVENTIFVVTIDGRLIAMRKSDGAVRWVTVLPGAIPEGIAATKDLPRYIGPVIANGEVLIIRKTGELYRFDAHSGKLISKSNLTSQITTPFQVANQHLVALSRDGTIRVFN